MTSEQFCRKSKRLGIVAIQILLSSMTAIFGTINCGFVWNFAVDIRCKIFTQVNFVFRSLYFKDIRKALDEDCIAFLSRETLRGIAYMHSQGKIHRDIKVCFFYT